MTVIIFDFYGVIFNPVTGQPMAGLVEFLKTLQKHTLVCGVASSSDSRSIAEFLDEHHLIKYFPVIIGADKVAQTKPDPECYQAVADYYQATPAECLVIDDSAEAIAQAKVAGFQTVYFSPEQNSGLDNFEKIATLLNL